MTLLLTFYGDDFTGSTDAMEALAIHGIKTVLFTRIPAEEEREKFSDCQALGIAGISRSRTPEWMDKNLPPIFEWLKQQDAGICHYKVCSTFDSSSKIGNIGRAAEIASRIFTQSAIPLIVGAPQLKRFTFAGNLYAGYQGKTYRIDRHPVMSNHPVTPMREADLRLHLAEQTSMPVRLVSNGETGDGLLLYDVHDLATQQAAAKWLFECPSHARPFIIGSSGVEYAVARELAVRKSIAGTATFEPLPAVDRTVVVSGSVSPTTERQISHAFQNGFVGLAVDPVDLASDKRNQTMEDALSSARAELAKGRSLLIYTGHGKASDVGSKLEAIPDGRSKVGKGLGLILKQLTTELKLKRIVISGGDTSGHALAQLGIHALTTRFPLPQSPGSPLCIGHSSLPSLQGIEIAMKGGQIGSDNYFVTLRDGLT